MSQATTLRALASGVLKWVPGPSHRMDCESMPWLPLSDGGRTLHGKPNENRCDCDRLPDNAARSELRALAERVLEGES